MKEVLPIRLASGRLREVTAQLVRPGGYFFMFLNSSIKRYTTIPRIEIINERISKSLKVRPPCFLNFPNGITDIRRYQPL